MRRAAILALLLAAGCDSGPVSEAKRILARELPDATVASAEARGDGLVCGWLDRADWIGKRRQRFVYMAGGQSPLARDLSAELTIQRRNRKALNCDVNPVVACATERLAADIAERDRFVKLSQRCGGGADPV